MKPYSPIAFHAKNQSVGKSRSFDQFAKIGKKYIRVKIFYIMKQRLHHEYFPWVFSAGWRIAFGLLFSLVCLAAGIGSQWYKPQASETKRLELLQILNTGGAPVAAPSEYHVHFFWNFSRKLVVNVGSLIALCLDFC